MGTHSQKIVVIVRTRNEERNIAKFCQSYQWTDQILVADGGSHDNTIPIALQQPKTKVKRFREQTIMQAGLTRNPAGEHINYMIEWATLFYRPDWLIFDDCDCFPNRVLKEDARFILESTICNWVYVTRLYLYGQNRKHFPSMSFIDDRWTPSLWAWKPETKLQFTTNEVNHTHEMTVKPDLEDRLDLFPPYCLLHNSWPDEEEVQRKLRFYKNSGQHPTACHPLEFCGELDDLPEWAVE